MANKRGRPMLGPGAKRMYKVLVYLNEGEQQVLRAQAALESHSMSDIMRAGLAALVSNAEVRSGFGAENLPVESEGQDEQAGS